MTKRQRHRFKGQWEGMEIGLSGLKIQYPTEGLLGYCTLLESVPVFWGGELTKLEL